MALASTSSFSAPAVVGQLRSAVRGLSLAPGDPRYEAGRRIWNGAVDVRPAVLVRVADAEDVAAAVRVAAERELRVSVRGGGHDWGGRAVRPGGMVIDLSGLRQVRVEADSGIAAAGGGARAGDLAAAGGPHGLAPVAGTVKAVGMAGLTLGGGYGLLNGRWGLALDNLVSADVVLGDGRTVTASAGHNPDLFWGLRGGGGNFGVVTAARYQLRPAARVVAGLLLFALDEAERALSELWRLLQDAPDELTVMSGFVRGPAGRSVLFLLPTWVGDEAAGAPWLDRLRRLGTPLLDGVRPMEFGELIGLFDDAVVDGRHNAMDTRWLPALSDDAIGLLVAGAASTTSPYSAIYLHHFHGAAARVAAGATAFALRREHVLVEIAAQWAPGEGQPHREWAAALSAALAPHALPGGYPNLLGPEHTDRALIGYGPHARRLRALKRRIDPGGVFSAVPDLLAAPAAAGRHGTGREGTARR